MNDSDTKCDCVTKICVKKGDEVVKMCDNSCEAAQNGVIICFYKSYRKRLSASEMKYSVFFFFF